jgi:hypothetical protein
MIKQSATQLVVLETPIWKYGPGLGIEENYVVRQSFPRSALVRVAGGTALDHVSYQLTTSERYRPCLGRYRPPAVGKSRRWNQPNKICKMVAPVWRRIKLHRFAPLLPACGLFSRHPASAKKASWRAGELEGGGSD